MGRSVSTSDVIVLKYNGDMSAHFVDSTGFTELDGFLGEESYREAARRESERTDPAFSQFGKRSDEHTADTKTNQTPELKSRKSLLMRLDEAKRQAGNNAQAASRQKERGYE
jgi:hypothetical protein